LVLATAGVVKTLLALSGTDLEEIKRSFRQRIDAQKKICLLQLHPRLSEYLGFAYNLYIHGPYSPTLARVYYELDSVEPAKLNLPERVKAYVDTISKMSTRQLELLATVISTIQYNPDEPDEVIVTQVSNLKPDYGDDEIRKSVKSAHSLRQKFSLRF